LTRDLPEDEGRLQRALWLLHGEIETKTGALNDFDLVPSINKLSGRLEGRCEEPAKTQQQRLPRQAMAAGRRSLHKHDSLSNCFTSTVLCLISAIKPA
jgi:hypothetical protein